MELVERPITDGAASYRSRFRRAGGERSLMVIAAVPAGQPVAGSAGRRVTAAVGADAAWLLPSPFRAVTRTRRVSPTSTPRTM